MKIISNILLLGIVAFSGPQIANGQKVSYANALHKLDRQVRHDFFMPEKLYYKEHAVKEPKDHEVSFLWPLCAMIQADNEMERLDPSMKRMQETFSVIEKYDDPAPPAPGYDSYPSEFSKEDRYYDDNQWIGIAAMDAYERTAKTSDLAMGKKIYRFMMTGYDTVSGGGLYWKEGDKTTKNTCSNGPAIILIMQLYKAKPSRTLLLEALAIYDWENKHLRSPEHLFYDNLNVKTGAVAKHFFSYNAGTMLQSNVYLYEATKDRKYLQQAVKIAGSATDYFLAEGKFRDDYWFSAVLLRGLQHLYKYDKDARYIKAFQVCTDHALASDLNANGLMGKDKAINLVGQGGMLEILARLAWMQKKGIIQ